MSNKDILETIDLDSITSLVETISYTNLTSKNSISDFPLTTEASITIERVLGEGGMGIVYLANQSHPSRKVAIKRLKKNNRVLRNALIQEAMITGALEHPTIIPVHVLKLEKDKSPEVIMKRIQGKTMLDYLEHSISPKEQRKMLDALCQVCNGLEYAHSKGIYHRDVKPENIMIGDFGEVYLLDWGIAVQKDALSGLPKGLIGTPTFLAPEMLSGDPKDVDERTDIYLLGATLHFILTNKYKHEGDNLHELTKSASISKPYKYDKEVPVMLADLANSSCHVDPDKRPQSASEFKNKIQSYLQFQQAFIIYEAALEDFEKLQILLSKGHRTQQEKNSMYRHFNRCRFGFEQALTIFPKFLDAKKKFRNLIIVMSEYHLSENNVETAQTLLEELDNVPQSLQAIIEKQIKERETLEHEAEQYRKNEWRYKKSSPVFQNTFIFGIALTCLIFLYNVLEVDDLDPNTITPEDLFYQSILWCLPVIPALILGRNKLLASARGRRAILGSTGALFVIILHRWIAMTHNEMPSSIIVVDIFILGLGLVNTTPTFKYGRWLAIICIFVGITNHFFPITFWLGSLLLFVIFAISILGDWKRNWNTENF